MHVDGSGSKTVRHHGALGRGGLKWPLAVAIAGSIGLCLVLSAEHWAGPFRPRSLPAIETVVVDQGDVTLVVTENGSIESSVDDVIRCGVESFSRLPVGRRPPESSHGRRRRES